MLTIYRRRHISSKNLVASGIAEQIVEVQQVFGKMFNAGTEFQRDGSQFDFLFNEGSQYAIGGMSVSVMHTPGHTPACMTHVIGDAAFVGDTLFMPDGGPELFLVVMLPSFIILSKEFSHFPRRPAFLSAMIMVPMAAMFQQTTVEERLKNIHVGNGASEAEFVKCEKSVTLLWRCQAWLCRPFR